MPLDGNGGYNPPSPENPVRAGTLIKSEDFNTTIDDIADALSTAMYKDGQGAIEADLDMGHHSLLRVKAVRNDEPMTIYSADSITINSPQVDIKTSLAINSGDKVIGITDKKREGNYLIRTNETGGLDPSLLPFQPTPESSVLCTAMEDVQIGDFVVIVGNQQIAPARSYPSIPPIGFVLQAALQGEEVLVYTQGYNNAVIMTGTPSYTRAAYIDISAGNSHTLLYMPNGGQFVGYAITSTTIKFVGVPATQITLAKLYYFGG